MDKVYVVETTHESGEKERREVEATHIIEAFQKGTYDCYATMVIVKEKVSRDYKAEIAYLTAENERLRGEVEEQKSIAEHEHATQMEWFEVACDYKAENAELRERLDKAIELPPGDRVWYIAQDEEGQENYIIPKPTDSLTVEELKYAMNKKYFSTREFAKAKMKEIKENAQLRARQNKTVEFTAEAEARLKELKEKTVYTVIKNCTRCQHYNASWAECRAPATANFDCESTHGTCFTQDIIDDECKKHLCVAKLEFDLRLLDPKTGELKPQYFIDEKVAEARLKEI